ncbi:MAG: family 16 glycoside hydrolase [Planctomycetota bacterium]
MRRNRYLLLDSRIIESAKNAKLTVGTVRKDKNNPLFKEDKPWEPRFDNPYCSVIYDEEEKIYKCWYSIFIESGPSGDFPGEGLSSDERAWVNWKEGERDFGVCYAASKDGILWEKPELGLIEFSGSKKNNIVIEYTHGVAVMKDLHETDPQKRYKAIHPERKNSAVWFSPDGIRWGKKHNAGAISHGDTNQAIWWDEDLGKYVLITRRWGGANTTGRYGRNGHRQKVRSVSADFLKWSKPELVIEGLDLRMQVHDMLVVPHAGVYVGMVGLFDIEASRQWCELAWSPDSIEWHRIQPGKPLIPNGPVMGDYDWGCIFASKPIIREDEILLYYGANDGRFMAWRNGFFCLARMRPDGFAGYEQIVGGSNKTGSLTTKPIYVVSDLLCVSADVAPSGFVKVAVLDRDNRRLAEGELVTTTVSDARIQWKDKFSLKNLKDKEIKLKFELRESKIFSFSFERNAGKVPERVEQSGNTIFDGKTLDGWHAVPKECASDWTVRDGAIVGHGSADRLAYLVWKDENLTDFELELRYRLPGNGNTGVEIRSQPDLTGKRPFEGYHADLGHVGIGPHILGAWDFHFATRKEYPCNRGTRLVIDENGKTHSSTIPGALTVADIRPHQWNDVRIVARGNHFQFFINGKLASEFTDNAKSGQLAHGAIGLQIHDKGMQVEFKDIRLKQL